MKCTCKIGHLGRGDNICEKHEMWAERLMMKFAKSMLLSGDELDKKVDEQMIKLIEIKK